MASCSTDLGAEVVRHGLDQDDAQADDRKLHGHGQADAQVFHGETGVPVPVRPPQVQDGQFPADVEHAQEGGKALGQDEGIGRARHAPVEFQNEEQRQEHIHHRRDDQEHDGGLAVPQGTQER